MLKYIANLTALFAVFLHQRVINMKIPDLYTLVPSFSLPDLQGRRVSLWNYKHQQPVVLVVGDANSESLLRDFSYRYPDYGSEGAEVLVILPQRPDGDDWPFPVLIDTDGRVSARLADRLPAILVLDSYNELYARFEGPWPEGANHRDILECIAQTELRCPECGVAEWPYP